MREPGRHGGGIFSMFVRAKRGGKKEGEKGKKKGILQITYRKPTPILAFTTYVGVGLQTCNFRTPQRGSDPC
jgi:hypothetical protein